MATKHYFSTDGNYGDATDLFVCETDEWTEEDWERLDYAHDWERPEVAKSIHLDCLVRRLSRFATQTND
jgi:hypothetical protein